MRTIIAAEALLLLSGVFPESYSQEHLGVDGQASPGFLEALNHEVGPMLAMGCCSRLYSVAGHRQSATLCGWLLHWSGTGA